MSQESELSALGITKLLRRNLVIGIIALELAAIGTLCNVVVALHREKDAAKQEVIMCKEATSALIDRIKSEQIKKLEEANEKLQAIERELRSQKRKK